MHIFTNDVKIVDVIIPVFNKIAYLGRALDSVLSQTYPIHKIIMIDDGSVDDIKGLVSGYQQRNPDKFIYIRQENSGPATARNMGLSCSDSEYVFFLDSDDEALPDTIEKEMAVFEKSDLKNLGLVYPMLSYIDKDGNIIKKGVTESKIMVRGWVFDEFNFSNHIRSCSGPLVKRQYIDHVGWFDVNLKGNEDWDMWLRLAKVCQFDFVDKELILYRQHSSSVSKNAKNMFADKVRFYEKWSTDEDAGRLKKAWRLKGDFLNREVFWGCVRQLFKKDSSQSFYRTIVNGLSPLAKERLFGNANKMSSFGTIFSVMKQAWRFIILLVIRPKRLISLIRNKL